LRKLVASIDLIRIKPRDIASTKLKQSTLEIEMAIRVLLPLFTFPDASPEGGLRNALSLAATLGASVSVLVHEVRIPPVAETFAHAVIDIAAMSEAAEALSRSRGKQLAKCVEAEANHLTLPLVMGEIRADRLLAGEAIAAAARSYDFTFLAGLSDSPDHALIIEDVLFRSGGPAIVFPAEPEPAKVETMAVAWDASRAASRALRDAVPLLQHARRVVILSAPDDKSISSAAAADATAFLATHGIEGMHVTVQRGASSIGEALQNSALEQGAGLLAMGAYGHSRLREFVLGGATKSVLTTPKLPVLMSH
jgi:nucleotide-binding universal stress UspA family protein